MNTSQNMAVLQAVTILVPMVSEKYISQLKFQQKLPIGTNRIKKEKGKNMTNILILEYIINELN